MSISNFPTALQGAIQTNMLEREFRNGLESRLGYRQIAQRERFAIRQGESITKTRKGLKAPVTTPMVPSGNTNLDNGLSPASWAMEQFTLAINMYGDTIDLNIVTEKVGIADQFLANAHTNGVQAIQSVDRLARDALYAAYLGGNTRVTATLGSPGTTIAVDDIRGFLTVLVNGAQVPVSGSNTMTCVVGAGSYTLTGATADVSNVSTAPGGISGTLTFSGNVSTANGTAGNAVVSAVAPSVVRPYNAGVQRATTAAITSTDYLTMQMIEKGVTTLRSNNVPAIRGCYNLYLDPAQMNGLFRDSEFQLLYRGTAATTSAFRDLVVFELLGVRYIVTTESPQQTLSGLPIHRAIMCGADTLVEGVYDATGYGTVDQIPSEEEALIRIVEDICMVTREPLDRLKQIVAQSWYYVGGFVVPTDQTANTNIIPTASNSYFKRSVVLESAAP